VSEIWVAGFVFALATALGGCAVAPSDRAADDAPATPPDWKPLWNFDDAAATEARFLEILPATRATGSSAAEVILLTQIARTRGLQRRFSDAHRTLDEAAALPGAGEPEPRVRLLLERGRTRNSGKEEGRGREEFLAALDTARSAGLDALAVDAAHMMGIIEPPDVALEWNDRAIAMAEASSDPAARKWLASLLNNQGWTRHGRGEFELALTLFEKARDFRQAASATGSGTLVARWAVARCHRSLGRVEEALAAQRALLDDWKAEGQEDGYVHEEMGECLLLLGRGEEARPHFARAHALLSADPWVKENEAERLLRLESLGKNP
jgi:tetratricopeptide (TPR) repeat protein